MTNQIDRRRFLQYTGAAGAATGALWVAPSVLGSSSAFAAGSCQYSATLNWANLGGGSMPAPSTATSVSGYAIIPASGPYPSIRVNMVVTPVGTPGTGAGVFNGLLNQTNGGIAGPQYFIGMANNVTGEGYTMTYSFMDATNTNPVNVYNLNMTVTDIDRSGTATNGYQDVVTFSPTPSSYTTHSGNVTGTNPFSATGGGNVVDTSNAGNVDTVFTGPINTVSVSFTSGNRLNAIQSISFPNITWCY